ncbi:MAG: MlaD family protein [Phycisphaerae bacterium]
MRESRQTFWVGLFVLVGLAALSVLIVLFGQAGFLTRRAGAQVINVRFDQATGIRTGTIVTVGGIQVGRVIRVDFVDPQRFDKGVNVQIALEPGRRLRQGSRARTSEPGLGMGRPPIVIEPGPFTEPVLSPEEDILGEISPAVESLFPKAIVTNLETTAIRIGEAAGALTPVLQDLHKILEPRDPKLVDQAGGPTGNLASSITRLDSGLKHWNDVWGDPEVKSKLRASFDNLHAMTEDGKVVVADMKEAAAEARATAAEGKVLIEKASVAITNIDGHAERLARDLTDNVELVSSFLTQMNTIVKKAEQGEGTIGRLFMDDRLYESLVLTFRRLAKTTEEFRLLVKEWQKGKIRVAPF